MGSQDEKKLITPSQSAFIFYRPAARPHPEQLYYNEDACSILARCAQFHDIQADIPPYVSSLCLQWSDLLENYPDSEPSSVSANGGAGMRQIALLESDKRKYLVKATTLADSNGSQGEKQYLFVIERSAVDGANLSMLFRKYKLNVREQDIVRLLLAGNGNKQIASLLSLSENTIKGDMKLLMRKLGVSNRAGIIGALMVEK